MRTASRLLAALALALVAPAAAQGAGPAPGPPHWAPVEKLLSEQKLEAASQEIQRRLDAARERRDEAEWTRALIKLTQVRIGLHGYEAAVRSLMEQPWPEGAVSRSLLHLYQAGALLSYFRQYSWEIRQRERVASAAPADLKAWSFDQLQEELHRALLGAWKHREALGARKVLEFSEYLEPNDYPPGLRDTLRDALAYLWTGVLQDSSLWRPEHANELFRLDLPALLRGGAAGAALADPAAHPLLRLGAVLDDLEAWHAAANRPQAALEARLERVRALHLHFTEQEDRARIRADLAERVKAARALPWSTVAMELLARLHREGEELAAAHRVATGCAKLHPGSVGQRRCAALAFEIAAPSFQMASMAIDGPGRRSLAITHKNLSALYFRAYARDVEQVAARHGYRLMPEAGELAQAVQSGRPEAEWTVELPPTPDFQLHRTFSTPPLQRRGLYWIVASDRRDFAPSRSNVVIAPLLISGLVLQTATLEQGGRNEVRVVSGATGQPIPGAQVELVRLGGEGKAAGGQVARTTGPDGLAVFQRPPGDGRYRLVAVARYQGDLSIEEEGIHFWRAPEPREAAGALVYTDRSVYRPRQSVLWKAVAYRGRRDRARFAAAPDEELTVTLLDANHQVVERKVVKTNRFGSAAGRFELPAGRLLGAWRLNVLPSRAAGPAQAGTAVVRVEEYRRPTFEVSIQDPASALRLNRPAALSGQARYYFGLPVTSGSVRWKVARQPVHPGWWGDSRVIPPPGSPEVIASGQGPLAADGTFPLTFTAQADERAAARGVTFTYQVTAEVTDEGGETRSASRGFRLGAAVVEGRIDLERGFLVEGEAGAPLDLLRVNLDGVPRPGPGQWTVRRLAMPGEAVLPADEPIPDPPLAGGEAEPPLRTPGDRLQPRFPAPWSPDATLRGWKEAEVVGRGAVTHDAQGRARAALPALAAGAYRITYQTTGELGAPFSTFRDVIVAGARAVPALPAVLKVERPSVAAGEAARVLVGSGIAGQVLLFEVHRGEERVVQRLLTAGQDPAVVELPVQEADRGGFTVSLTLVRDHQGIHLTEDVHVPHDDKELKVELSTFRDLLRPGAKETFRVTVSGKEGALGPGAAEVLAYMYDRALDFFAPHLPPGAQGLYPQRAGRPALRVNLGQSYAGSLWTRDEPPPEAPPLSGDQLRFFPGFALGGPGERAETKVRAMPSGRGPAGTRESGPGLAEAAAPRQDARPGPLPAPEAPAPELRQDFAETAFFRPQLLTDQRGTVTIELTVPDSVTAWNVYAHAVTADLRLGSTRRETRSIKELMVRPYVPRFFREGDQAELKVVLHSAAARDLPAEVTFDIVDADTGKSALELFTGGKKADRRPRQVTVARGGSANLSYALTAPARAGVYAFRVVARSGDLSDGELRPVPVLPSRMHLTESRFAALQGRDREELTFPGLLRDDDPTRLDQQLVVTIDAQLAHTALQALPYLLEYPYQCTEQILNRFVSAGIVSSLFQQHPVMARMAEKLAQRRDTPLETFDAVDPNRKVLLEETPWLWEARGAPRERAVEVLDPRLARAQRDESLRKLREAQLSSGAFPWWPGGPPSPYFTLYIAQGLARAAEHRVEVPRELSQRAWSYLGAHLRSATGGDLRKLGVPFLTFLNFVASSDPDESSLGGALSMEERRRILDLSFEDWKRHPPYLKGLLALTLKRMGRPEDAALVFESVMDSAHTTPEQGTFWAPEDRAWLWYHDTLESHAFALRVLTELRPDDPRRAGLVQWLLLNKKLSHWKSTRATAEAIYALVKHLQEEGALAVREELKVTVGRRAPVSYRFQPDDFTGKKNQLVVPGEALVPATDGKVVVEKSTPGLAFASATWHFSTGKMPEEERGDFFQVGRRYFRRVIQGRETALRPLGEGERLAVGDEVEVQLSLRAKHAAEYVHLRDPRGAGFEPEGATSRYRWDRGLGYYEEVRDSGANFFFDWLPAGEHTFRYRLRATMAGAFRAGPATVQSMYAPEFNAYSAGHVLTIAP